MKSSFSQVDEIHDMTIQQTEMEQKKSIINEKMHPGFMCFFHHYLDQASISFNQCMQSLMIDTNKMPNPLPISQIINLDTQPNDKIQMLKGKTKENVNFLYFFKNPDENAYMSAFIDSAREKKKQLEKMENQLKFSEGYKQRILNERLEEFRLKREEEEKKKKALEQKMMRQQEENRKKMIEKQKSDDGKIKK